MTSITPAQDAEYAARFPHWNRYDLALKLDIIAGDAVATDQAWKQEAALAEQAQEQAAYAAEAQQDAYGLIAAARAAKAKRLATDKQFAFIKKLLAEKDASAVDAQVVAARAEAVAGTLTSKAASALIETLLAQPRKAAPAKADEPQAGIYRLADQTLVRVYLGQKQGVMLAKRVDTYAGGVEYTYLGKASRFLQGAERLPLDQVGRIGIATGTCLCCGRRLDDPESVDRGIGPVCAARYDG
jgi:hypothetical protein